MKNLPIGIQTFRKIIEGNYIYIDKTRFIYNLIHDSTGTYFLSRPRRFGKSLLLSTLEEIFQGNKELFQGLWLYDSDYTWQKFPIIRLDFSTQRSEAPEQFKTFLIEKVDSIAQKNNISLTKLEYYSKFEELIHKLHESFGKVVILIDEYDKPIIDWLEEPELAKKMRSVVKGFFSILKGNDAYIRFLFLTGVSKFSKAGVFSDLNHLKDISLHDDYSSMLGITEDEFILYFPEHITTFIEKEKITRDAFLQKMRFWYNGYKFSPDGIPVYNPFSTLLLFDSKRFQHYWFETGTPSFLVNLMIEKDFSMEEVPLIAEELIFSSYEVEDLSPIPLLLQTGYLTIKDYDPETMLYTLDYPNYEVKRAFLSFFLKKYRKKELSESVLYKILNALKENDIDSCMEILRHIFSEVDYSLHIPLEKYYQTIFYLIFTMMGLKVHTEVSTNRGRIDAVIEDKAIFIFEFKFNGTKEEAIAQIKTKRYYEKYLNRNKEIYLIGAEFKDRNIGEYIMQLWSIY